MSTEVCVIINFFFSPPCAGTLPVHPGDGVRIHPSLRHHHNQLRPHPQTHQADQVPEEDPQREAHPDHRGHVRPLLAAVPHHQHDTGVWRRAVTTTQWWNNWSKNGFFFCFPGCSRVVSRKFFHQRSVSGLMMNIRAETTYSPLTLTSHDKHSLILDPWTDKLKFINKISAETRSSLKSVNFCWNAPERHNQPKIDQNLWKSHCYNPWKTPTDWLTAVLIVSMSLLSLERIYQSSRAVTSALAFISSCANPVLYTFAGKSYIKKNGLAFMAKLFEGITSEQTGIKKSRSAGNTNDISNVSSTSTTLQNGRWDSDGVQVTTVRF